MGPFAVCSPVTGWFSPVYDTEAEAQLERERRKLEVPNDQPVVVVEENGNAMQIVRDQPAYLGGPRIPVQLRTVGIIGGRGAVVRWSPSC